MKVGFHIAGYAAAGLLAGTLATLILQPDEQGQQRLATLTQTNQQLREDVDFNQTQDLEREKEINDLRQRITTLEKMLAEVQAPMTASNGARPATAPAPAHTTTEPPSVSIPLDIPDLKRSQQEARLEIMSQYKKLFDQLNLIEEQQRQLENVLVDQEVLRSDMARRMLTGEEVPSQEILGFLNPLVQRRKIRSEAAEILTPGQMQQFGEYEQSLAEKNLRSQHNRMVYIQAEGLEEANRQSLVDSLVDELAKVETDIGQNQQQSFLDFMQQQRQRIDNVRKKLAGTMSDEQWRIAENYLNRQEISVRNFNRE